MIKLTYFAERRRFWRLETHTVYCERGPQCLLSLGATISVYGLSPQGVHDLHLPAIAREWSPYVSGQLTCDTVFQCRV